MAHALVFYSTKSRDAKIRAREICAVKPSTARVIDVAAWDDHFERVDFVEVMPDVPGWQRKRIEKVYGDKIREPGEQTVAAATLPPVEDEHRRKLGDMPPRADETQKPERLRMMHKGGGNYLVYRGEKLVSGPHTKTEAQDIVIAGEKTE